MPTSHHDQISSIVDLVRDLDPKSVLDVGTGFGKYGVLCREYLELWDGRGEYRFLRRIDGIEAFKGYLTPLHSFIYDNMFLGNALELVSGLDFHYDLILLVDVLEHLSKPDGKCLVKNILEKSDGLLVSTPKRVFAQKAVFGNGFETHISQWTKKELSGLGRAIFVKNPSSFIVYIGRRDRIEGVKKARFLRRLKRVAASIPLILWVVRSMRGLKKK